MRHLCPIGILGAFLAIAGCSGQGPPTAPPASQIYDFRSEGTFPAIPDVVSAPARGAAPAAVRFSKDGGEARAVAASAAADETRPSPQGWRVQVFAGRSEEVARNIQRQLQGVISEPVYLEYVEPYYKVRVGDCDEREPCDDLQRRLRALGSESAWVVWQPIQTARQP